MELSQCDLILKDGHVIDPAAGLSAVSDVAISNGRIAAIAPELPASGARCVDVSGCLVVPGLIDIHCHCYPTFPFAHDSLPTIHPDAHMFQSGVTTCVDAGTCGWRDFPRFKEEVIDKAAVRVLAFLNIADGGMVHMDTEDDPTCFHSEITSEVASAFRDCVVGIKTAHYWVNKPFDRIHTPWASVDAMTKAGDKAGMRCMADFQPTLPQRTYQALLMEHLRPGDIHTHMYAQQFDLLDAQGQLLPFLRQARERGILFDTGHGAGSFWFRNAVPSIAQGHVPDTISTDLYIHNVAGPVISLTHVMSKFLAMGMPMADVIDWVTAAPARLLGRPELGTLRAGTCADIAVLREEKRPVHFADSGHARMDGDRVLRCEMTLRAGRIVYDPYAAALPAWETAPERYWTSPGVL